jgi:hypothetical protein
MPASEARRPENTGALGSSGYPPRYWWLGASALCMVVGSAGTWAKNDLLGTTMETWSGVERHGWISLLAGVAALAAATLFAKAARRPRPLWPLAVCATAAVLGAVAATYDFFKIESSDEFLGANASGWGLYLTWMASVSLFFASAVCVGQDTSVQVSVAAFSAHHQLSSRALRWTGFALLGADVIMLFALGQGLIETGPETETLGQGFVGGALLSGGVLLVLVALLAYWLPRLAGTLLIFLGFPLFIAVAAGDRASDCDPNCWVDSDRQGELSGLAAAIANSDLLSLMLFLLPPIAGLVLFVAGFFRYRDQKTSPGNGPKFTGVE